ncbi:tubulin--tyrosine ligase-like protein 12 [Asterias rubens]|uniref:tubulin--tyrosine ligase-like protein 12 n=1 Tax=Asterias rubens TaxID=7604 RepID=UPI001455A419|nr:tubulin--tyrosine ligase-like protein 12 [Asterias rubens]
MENGLENNEYNDFVLVHKPQLEKSGVPQHFWHSLYLKLSNQVYDAGEKFMLTYMNDDVVEECEEDNDEEQTRNKINEENTGEDKPPKLKVVVSHEDGLSSSHEDSIFLIDHAWTYRLIDARHQLHEVPGLLARLMSLMELNRTAEDNDDACIDRVLEESWKYNRTYSLNIQGLSTEDKQPVWYILDEFGSRIHHSDTPNCRLVPLLYASQNIAYDLLFPLRHLEYGEDVTVDFAFNHPDPLMRQIHLLPWQHSDLTHVSTEHPEPDDAYLSRCCNYKAPVVGDEIILPDTSKQLKVFSNNSQASNNLKHPKFVIVEKEEEADILYVSKNRDYRKISTETHQFISQFPGEKLITTKDLLAFVSRRAGTKDQSGRSIGPKWLPVTFDLLLALPQFVSYFQQQKQKGAQNIWICKPVNLARSLDTVVTNDLNHIIRQTETDIPKVACEYLTDPVLYLRDGIGPVKFDLRFIVMLSSVKPLKLYVYKIFWTRFANKPFSLDHLDDYNKHFTVMNYVTGGEVGDNFFQVLWHEFATNFNQQFPSYNWEDTESNIHQMILEFFQAAILEPPPKGIAHCPWSRAMYGLDVMLKWDTNHAGEKVMQPVLLECNFFPDCERACWHRKEFFDDIFSTLFLGDITDRPVKELH